MVKLRLFIIHVHLMFIIFLENVSLIRSQFYILFIFFHENSCHYRLNVKLYIVYFSLLFLFDHLL